MDRSSIDTMPPIPTRTHRVHSSQRSRISSTPTSAARKRYAIPPGSPEIISSLIQSLSAIAEPANHHFDNGLVPTNRSLPTNPNPGPHSSSRRGSGSFGVDYGAYKQRSLHENYAEPVSLDDLAASPPVVRTSKPPSGFSPLTAPQSPRSHRSTSRESGFRSFIRSAATSRPSSTGSFASKNDDARSIGNLSVERGSAPHPELRPRRSLDSWGKKSSRGSKVLSYMGSKEHLREPQIDRRRASSTPIVGGSSAAAGSSIHSASKTDNFFAGGAINEEPAPITTDDSLLGDGLHHIPVRDSSLRNSSSSRKRASTRRSMKEGEASISDKIVETTESGYGRDFSKMKHRRSDSDTGKTFLYDVEEIAPPKLRTKASSTYLSVDYIAEERPDELEDDGAPFPSVSQGRRRDELDRKDHRLSTRTHPGPNEGLRLKRSSSRLKRLSAPLTPQENKRPEEPAQSVKPTGYERPQSADSIDDAVESYLCSPRLSQKIRHPQTGRIISFSEVGDPEGFAVFCCVGMGLTRYITAFYDELALTLRLRLITPDRPGVGDSEPYTDGTSTPSVGPIDDVYAICQTLKITKFSLMAHSAGAIYALATALRMPQHIRGKIHLLAPWIPPSQMNVFGSSQANPPQHTLPTAQRILRVLPTSFLKAANSSFMSATSSSITSSLPKNPRRTKRKTGQKDGNSRNATPSTDKENANQAADGKDSNGTLVNEGDLAATNAADGLDKALPRVPAGSEAPPVMDPLAEKERQQTYDIRLTHAIWELATTNANPAVDLLICLERQHTIGFRYVDITRPVIIRHGSRDTRVPVENVKWLGKTMRRCEVRVLEGEGHGLMASATVMGSVLMEISREWEDSVKAAASEGKERERGRRRAPSK